MASKTTIIGQWVAADLQIAERAYSRTFIRAFRCRLHHPRNGLIPARALFDYHKEKKVKAFAAASSQERTFQTI
jgi:hypothetical protein